LIQRTRANGSIPRASLSLHGLRHTREQLQQRVADVKPLGAGTALEQPVNEAQTYVQQQPAANVDETGWYERLAQAGGQNI